MTILPFVISDLKQDDQGEVKEDEKEKIKKQLIDDEEEDRKLFEAIPDESEDTETSFISILLCLLLYSYKLFNPLYQRPNSPILSLYFSCKSTQEKLLE